MAIYSEANTYEMSHKADQVKILVDVAVDCGMEKNVDLFKYLFERVYHVQDEAAAFASVFGETMSALKESQQDDGKNTSQSRFLSMTRQELLEFAVAHDVEIPDSMGTSRIVQTLEQHGFR